MTGNEFKTRYSNHKASFKHRKLSLSKYVWELKEKQQEYEINWSILRCANACQSGSETCSLCLAEKLCILYADKRFLLNKRSELVSKCRHQNKFLCKYIQILNAYRHVHIFKNLQSDDRFERETRVTEVFFKNCIFILFKPNIIAPQH